MKPPIIGAFGKLERAAAPRGQLGEVVAWHPLAHHSIDVAACFEAIVRQNAVLRALEATAGRPLDAHDLARLGVLVLLHDIGKANRGFQNKRHPPGPKVIWAGHVDEFYIFLLGNNDFAAKLLTELLPEIINWGRDTFIVGGLLRASVSHHGRPAQRSRADLTSERLECFWKARLEYDPMVEVARLVRCTRRMFAQAFAPVTKPLPSAAPFGHLFAGLVQLADWIGSDRRHFDFSSDASETADEDRMAFARSRAVEAVQGIGLDIEQARSACGAQRADFSALFRKGEPSAMQLAAADLSLGRLVVLEAETGSGKTEAALWRFIALWQARQVDALYFALPTRVAASQLYGRVCDMVEHLLPDQQRVGVVRALPGYEAFDRFDVVQKLPDFTVLWSDDPNDAEAHRRWAAESPKRFLAAPLAVGTIDQALLGALQARHAHMRQALLARSLLVVDEVHASDSYMTAVTRHLLRAHLKAGGHALLLSATLGSRARSRYLQTAHSVDLPYQAPVPKIEFEAACAVPYPSVSSTAGTAKVDTRLPSAGRAKPKIVLWRAEDRMLDPEWIGHLALDYATRGAKVMVVRNTVRQALALQQAVERLTPNPGLLFSLPSEQGEPVITLHHGRFARSDRPCLDKRVEELLSRERPPGGLVLVGTQTLEQSLDIDCDLLITDLCPIDVLLQRIGRLHRHAREPAQRGPAGQPCCIVLSPQGHDLAPYLAHPAHGFGLHRTGLGVYRNLVVLEATRRLIASQATVTIPQDNRRLVESATHSDRLDELASELGPGWVQHQSGTSGTRLAEEAAAKTLALAFDKSFFEVEAFDNDFQVTSRLGVADRTVTLEPVPTGPFSRRVESIAVPAHLIRARSDKEAKGSHQNSATPEPIDGGFRFELDGTRFKYTRLGVERDG